MMVGGEQPEEDSGVCHENEMVSVLRLLMGAVEMTSNGVLVMGIGDATREIDCSLAGE